MTEPFKMPSVEEVLGVGLSIVLEPAATPAQRKSAARKLGPMYRQYPAIQAALKAIAGGATGDVDQELRSQARDAGLKIPPPARLPPGVKMRVTRSGTTLTAAKRVTKKKR